MHMSSHVPSDSDSECDSSTDSEYRSLAIDLASEAIDGFFYDQWLEEEECLQVLDAEAAALRTSTLSTTHILVNILAIFFIAVLAWTLR